MTSGLASQHTPKIHVNWKDNFNFSLVCNPYNRLLMQGLQVLCIILTGEIARLVETSTASWLQLIHPKPAESTCTEYKVGRHLNNLLDQLYTLKFFHQIPFRCVQGLVDMSQAPLVLSISIVPKNFPRKVQNLELVLSVYYIFLHTTAVLFTNHLYHENNLYHKK